MNSLRAAVERELPGVRADLERLIRIPGVAFDGFDHSAVERSAGAVGALLRDCGLSVRTVRAGGRPAVIGHRAAPPGAPTVLLYAHHDVQPAGDPSLWSSDPFEPTERDGRLYGRGAADDKSGVMAHVAALRAFGDDLPVGVTVLVEGEEEYGSGTLGRIVAEHRDLLAADVIVVADSDNWEIGRPALTTSLRGTINCHVDVTPSPGSSRPVAFDALTALARLLATLHDRDGSVAVAGLTGHDRSDVDLAEEHFRRQAGLLDGVRLLGRGRLTDRLWHRPSVAVLGLDAPPATSAADEPVRVARAKIGVRLAPGDDPAAAYAALRTHLLSHTPRDAQVTVELESAGAPCRLDTSGPAYAAARAALTEAWDGTAPVDIGIGGSIPCVALLRSEFPSAAMLVTGVEDPYCAAHGPDESLHLAEFARTCLAEAYLLRNLAETAA